MTAAAIAFLLIVAALVALTELCVRRTFRSLRDAPAEVVIHIPGEPPPPPPNRDNIIT